jgi:hypothetical protein
MSGASPGKVTEHGGLKGTEDAIEQHRLAPLQGA